MPIGFGSACHVASRNPSHFARVVRVLNTKPPPQGEAGKFGNVASRVDIGVTRAECLVDDNAAAHTQPRGPRQLDIWFDPNADDGNVNGCAIVAIGMDDELVASPMDAIDALAKSNINPVLPKIYVQEVRERTRI